MNSSTASQGDAFTTTEPLLKFPQNRYAKPLWQIKCEEAEKESDPVKLAGLISEAEDAIVERLQNADGDLGLERRSIDQAIKTLRRLQVSKLNYPTWENEG
jgi:hypothetical protein